MYHFAIVALLALGTLKLVDFVVDNVGGIERFRSLLTFVAAVGAVWMLDYSLFDGFGVAVRERDTGMWISGFIVAGMTVPWRALFAYVTHEKATGDETLGNHSPMRRVA
ncbi:MAG: hypothetical protein WD691_07365 [Acidimicrobiales bacterium]